MHFTIFTLIILHIIINCDPNQEVVAETPDALTLFAVLLFALLLAPATVPGQVGV